MEAKFIITEGEYLEAVIEVNGKELHVMDKFSTESLASGDIINLEIMPGLFYEDEEWEEGATSIRVSGRPNPKENSTKVKAI